MKHWIDSGFTFVKDLLNNEGQWLHENEILDKLTIKRNWLIKLTILKKMWVKLSKQSIVLQ